MTGRRDWTVGDDCALDVRRRDFDGVEAVAVEWRFEVHGGTFGEREAEAFAVACEQAVAASAPLVTVTRTGGTRLQQGMRSLVGIPRAALSLGDLAAAGLPHVSVAANPTTGGVWVAIGSQADLRAAVQSATVGFSGPRVIEAMTGEVVPRGANTAESAVAAGLVDAVVAAEDVDAWVARALRAVRDGVPRPHAALRARAGAQPPARHGWDQVVHSRETTRPDGRELVETLLSEPVVLGGADETVFAAAGRLHGRAVVGAAVAAHRAGRVSVPGYGLLTRAAELAGRLHVPLVTLVDSAGADPVPASEDAGIAAAIGDALGAVLRCAAPTIAVVHGEGGSGGALAAAVGDSVVVTSNGWFAALAPEGAAAALRTTPEQAAEVMRLAPAELLADGFADAVVPADPDGLGVWLATELERLSALAPPERRARREGRWRRPLQPRGDDDSP